MTYEKHYNYRVDNALGADSNAQDNGQHDACTKLACTNITVLSHSRTMRNTYHTETNYNTKTSKTS